MARYLPNNISVIISGGAIGVDSLAEYYADKNNISKIIIKPEYDKFNKRAPIIRNMEIVDLADMIIAFWDGKSKGTKFTIDYALSKGKKIVVHNIISL